MKDLQDVADIVDNEGLDYSITDMIGPDEIENEELRKLWAEAFLILEKIEKILRPYMP